MHVGLGQIQYAFDPKRTLVLGGVKIPGAWGLRGPGDADAVLQAVLEALLGAAALGDAEDHFPVEDPRWAGAPSAVLLVEALTLLSGAGLAPAHVDVTLQAERPSLREHRAAMRERLTSLLRLDAARVSVKAPQAGGLGAPGRAEGIAALAVVSLREVDA